MTRDTVPLCFISAHPGDTRNYRKALGLDDDFQLVQAERHNIRYGRYEVRMVSMRRLYKGLCADPLPGLAFYTAGTPAKKDGVIDDVFRRTAKNFPPPQGPALLVIDNDKLDKFGLNTPEDVVRVLREELGIDADMVTSSSASSYLREEIIGKADTQLRGLHTFVPIDKGSEAARLLEVLHRLAWLHGYGRIEVSHSGALLERSIVDLAMQRPNQPIFEHGAIVSNGLRQDRRVAFHEGNARVLRSGAFRLSEEEEREFERLVKTAKAAKAAEAAVTRERWLDTKAARFPAESRTAERVRLAAQLNELKRDLAHNDTVTLNDRTEISVSEILAAPDRFPHMMTLRDPFEPDYGPSKATLFREGQSNGFVKIISHAHGLTVTYWLHPDPNIKLNDTGEEVLARLREMRPEEIRDEWLEMAVDLGPIAVQAVLDAVAQVLRSQKRPLQQSLTEYRKSRARDRRNHRVAELAGRRVRVLLEPGDPVRYARQIEGLIVERARETGRPETFIRFADCLCEVRPDVLPHVHEIDDEAGEAPLAYAIRPLNRTAIEERIAAVVQLERQTENGPRVVDPEQSLVTRILEIDRGAAPAVSGLVPHPIVLGKGEIVSGNGLHERSRLVLVNASIEDCRPFSQSEAVAALARLRETVLDGFEFDTPLDADSTLAMLVTGVQRKALDQAPGFMVLAASQSSGKTTLARCVHVLLTGLDMAVLSLPAEEVEVEKRVFAVLCNSPAMMCFDNVADGHFYSSAAIAGALTSATYQSRVLQESRMGRVPSTTLIVMTGNNLRLGFDEINRFVTIRLAPRGPRPEERRFAHTDVVSHMRQVRAQVLRDVVGIVSGYQHAGLPKQSCKGTRFAAWERQVRDPLMWAGAGDVGEVFGCNREDSEDEHARELLLRALRDRANGAPFLTRNVIEWADGWDVGNPIHEALTVRGRRVGESRSVGAELAQLVGRRYVIDDTVWSLAKVKKDRTGFWLWKVVEARAT